MIAVLMLLILKSGTVRAWSVTFENPDPCALKGSSVEFRCSYNYSKHETVNKTTWYKGALKRGLWKRVKLSDLPSYENRTEYLGDLQHNCSLVIHDVKENDTGHYYFRFDTYTLGWHSRTNVHLSVKELSARVYPDTVRAGDTVTLECTSCQLPSVWFKDGRRVAKTEFQAQVEDAGNYACAVEGQESALSAPVALDVQYPPLNVSAEVSYSGHLKANSSVNLTCSSAANPPANYTWYKRTDSLSSTVQVGSGQVLSIPSVRWSHSGLYLCQARNQLGANNSTEELLTVDVTDRTVSAWSVTFENPDPCALKGSSVEFRCSYNYSKQETVYKTTWYKGASEHDQWKRVKLSDLPSYENRTEYLGDLQHNCSLVIHDVKENDTGHYYFRFDTYTLGWRDTTSVHLSVKELSARVYPDTVRAGDTVTLECTSCQLPSVWFKDGHRIAKTEFQAQVEDAGNYACAVEGQESALSAPVALDVQYPPLNVSAEVSYSGHLKANSGVNLTCSSAANPPANYTWYKRTDSLSSTVQVGSGQVLSIPYAEASHTGLYLCQARNQVGANNSTEVLLTVDVTDINRVILLVGIGVKVIIMLMLTLVIIWAWRQRRSSAVDKEMFEENSNDYGNVPTARTKKTSV